MLLFALSIALSKSAANVLLTLSCLTAAYFAIRFPDVRRSLRDGLRQPLLLPLLLYVGVAVLGLAYTEKLPDGLGIVNKMAGMTLVYLMTAVAVDSFGSEPSCTSATENLLLAFVAGVFVLDIIGLLTYSGVIGDRKFFLPLYPLHVHHIWFANINAVGFYASGLLLLLSDARKDRRKRYLLLAFLPLSILCVLLSLSRTAWLGIAITSIVMSAVLVKNRRHLFLLLAVLVTGGLAAYGLNRIVHERIDLIFSETALFFSGQAQTNIGERFLMWKAAFRMFLSDPLFGVGTGDYVATMQSYIRSGAFPEHLSQYNQPHNIYFFALATNGLLGFGTLLYLFYRILAFSQRLLHDGERGRLFGCLGLAVAVHYLVGGFTDSFFNILILRYTFAFIMGVSILSAFSPRTPTKSL